MAKRRLTKIYKFTMLSASILATVIYALAIIFIVAYYDTPTLSLDIQMAEPTYLHYSELKPQTIAQQTTDTNVSPLISRGTPRTYYTVPLIDLQQDQVQDLCNMYDLPGVTPELLYAMMKTESNFNLNAWSKTNDVGILQINLRYFNSYVQYNTEPYKLYQVSSGDLQNFIVQVITSLNALSYWMGQTHNDLPGALNCYNRGFLYFKDHNTTYSTKIFNNLDIIKKGVLHEQ